MTTSQPARFIGPDALLAHWQGHRHLTRRVIDAFPEDKLFTYSSGGMRTFGEMALEIIFMGVPMLRGLTSGAWDASTSREPRAKAEVLRLWDDNTAELNRLWAQLSPEQFEQRTTAFGQYEDVVHNLILYVIDNEIHHRAQGFVFLRELGIDPPPFYERG